MKEFPSKNLLYYSCLMGCWPHVARCAYGQRAGPAAPAPCSGGQLWLVWKDELWITFCQSWEQLWSNALQEAVNHSHLKLEITLLQSHFCGMSCGAFVASSSH